MAILDMNVGRMGWHTPYAAIGTLRFPKEQDVDDKGDAIDGAGAGAGATGDPYAARRDRFDELFRALPRPGTPAYWQALEGSSEQPMPLEVLARCWRERWRALAALDAERILLLIFGRVEGTIHRWAQRSLGAIGRGLTLSDDLENACYEGIWQEVKRDDEPFLLENFNSALEHIQQHALQELARKEGLQNKHTEHPKRVPRAAQESLSAQVSAENETYTFADAIADARAQEQFDLDVLCSDVRDLLASLSDDERALLYYDIEGELTQDEIGQRLGGVTGRTVRSKLKKLRAHLRARYGRQSNEASRPDVEEADHGKL